MTSDNQRGRPFNRRVGGHLTGLGSGLAGEGRIELGDHNLVLKIHNGQRGWQSNCRTGEPFNGLDIGLAGGGYDQGPV